MSAAVKERPILFSGPMVRAILAGTKTQTRRVVKGNVDLWEDIGLHIAENPCPYGVPGDRLWVRETWQRATDFGYDTDHFFYRATYTNGGVYDDVSKWRPSIFMPRRASRITLELTDVRVQRLQEISEEDAIAEGCAAGDDMHNELYDPNTGRMTCAWVEPAPNAKESFCNLWQRIHKRPRGDDTSWEENPWVWAVSFNRVAP